MTKFGINLGEDNPVPDIPPGGIAYTNNGNFLCIFFGQTPAWSVEYI
ncbi:cyclophilin-like family protein [Thermodesulfobacteriota bacterium]